MQLLPSPGAVLVTSTGRAPSSADEKIRLVRTDRMASAKLAGTPLSSNKGAGDSSSRTLRTREAAFTLT